MQRVWLILLIFLTFTAACEPSQSDSCGGYMCDNDPGRIPRDDSDDGPDPDPVCGDGDCHLTELDWCDLDCIRGSSCGDSRCDDAERSAGSCAQDCGGGQQGCWNSNQISSAPIQLQIGAMAQQCQQWCWAAVTSMVGAYYGAYLQQCELASLKAGFTAPACCQYAACGYQPCDQPALPAEIDGVLGSVLGLYATRMSRGLDENELQIEISNGRPVIVGYTSSFSGHVVLVTGFSGQTDDMRATYTVVDPYYGVFQVTHHELAYGYGLGTARWAETWYQISPSADGCF